MTNSRIARYFIVGFLSALFGAAKGADLLSGHLSTAEGFVDIDLPIVQTESKSPNVVSVVARGKIHGSVVGLAVDISPTWTEKPIENARASVYWGKVRLRSIGSESDAFSKLLAGLYHMPCATAKMPQRMEAEAVGLSNDPRLVKSTPTRMKLFLNSNSQNNYAEVYLNLDLNSKVLQFHEKDPGYRAPLLRALCGES
ncbi:hypothetical protein FDZ73_21065 [bacterium]|nr:MAG: hypothetical protein FDZ73_21065 [bacterium]